jgi:predicted TPR repeat methyltransferase
MDPPDDGWLLRGSADPADVAAYYDEWAQRYDADLDGWAYRAPGIVAGIVLEHAPRADVVLDAGCGTGRTGRALRSAGYHGDLHGIDLSEESLAIARRSQAYTSIAPADLQQPLTFPDNSFDALTCVGVMTYVPDVEVCWREFSRIVRPGGVVVVTQREDLWEQRQCQSVIDRLHVDGTWEPLWVSDAEPYLPGNDDFAEQIGVYYVATRINRG